MKIIDPQMARKFERALKESGHMYSLADIEQALETGDMQSHTINDFWAITQVHDYPQGRSVSIMLAVGDMAGAILMEEEIQRWAKGIGAKTITAIGRSGWWKHRTPGWRKLGTVYSKDIDNEQ